jgi:hypothetical protein
LPDFGKGSGFYFTPGKYIVRVRQMVGEAAIKLCFLRFGHRWRGTTTNDAVPDGLNQLNLLINVEYTSLL